MRTSTREGMAFLVITLSLSWLVFWGPLAVFGVPTISFVDDTTGPVWAIVLFMIGGFTPSLTALVMVGVREGRPGLRNMWRRLTRVGIGWRWYLTILGIVAVGGAGQILLLRVLGHEFEYQLFILQLGSLAPLLVIGPLSEEIGWRGYALDRLQSEWGPLPASLILGAVWGLWHLPLFHMVGTSQNTWGIPFLGFLVGIISLSVIFTWLHNKTGGSVWTAVVFHWLYTWVAQVVATGATRSTLYNWLEYVPWLIIAVVVAVAGIGLRSGRPSSRVTE